MKLNIFTLALDAMPWIGAQFAELTRLQDVDWQWVIVEGAAMPKKDTRWMNSQSAKVSSDTTNQFLKSLDQFHPRISLISQPAWEGKTEMINRGLQKLKDPGILLQMDSDELWTSSQLSSLPKLFNMLKCKTLQVEMQYMVGPNVVATSNNGYGNRSHEWIRAWEYEHGLWMECHEPPRFNSNLDMAKKEEVTPLLGKILHMAWVTPQQIAQKQRIYGDKYKNAIADWEKLQKNESWPVEDLEQYLPWVGKNGKADKLY